MEKPRVTDKKSLEKAISKGYVETEHICPLCGAQLEVEPESHEVHCPVCEDEDNG